MSPRDPCEEGLVPSPWCYWEMVDPLGGGTQWEALGHRRGALKQDWTLVSVSLLFCFLCLLLLLFSVCFIKPAACSTTHSHRNGLPQHRHESSGTNHELKSLKLCAKNNPFLFWSWLPQEFCYSSGKLVSTKIKRDVLRGNQNKELESLSGVESRQHRFTY
jgi:hypothetical protein